MGRMIAAGPGARPTGAGMSVPGALDGLPRRLTGWAVNRYLAPVSVTGISLALGLCAAAWFSAGTTSDSVSGALALCGSYLALRAAWRLADPASGAAPRSASAGVSSLAELGGTASELAVYAGLAAGGYEAHQDGTWQLAVTAAIVLAVRRTLVACSRPVVVSHRPLGRALLGLLACPPGGRIALIAVAAPVGGARVTLLAVLEWGIVAACYALARRGPYRRVAAADLEQAPVSATAALSPWSGGPERPEASLTMTGPAEPPSVLDGLISAGPGPRQPAVVTEVADPQVLATLVACRDDGSLAVRLGQLVRGQFVPLPPAVAGLAATCFLAWLGMRNLPGILLLTPLVVMLLAAFGSAHPHDGRLDWLTPAVLLAGQLVYLATVGFSFRIPALVTFTVCAVTALRYVELATRARPPGWHPPDTRLGWEGRMLVAGLGAMFGIAIVGYLVLTAYLVALVGQEAAAGYLAARDGPEQ
jgi:hypothetical protein